LDDGAADDFAESTSMKIFPHFRPADAKEMRRQGERAFTMVEIAIAIGVIGFALVAIIGILPTGMNVQKDNREDTVISQDAPYFLDAIRNGAPVTNYAGNNVLAASAEGLDFLTNYVQSIRFDYYDNGVINSNLTTNFTKFYSGAEILGLLSTPQTNYNSPYFSNNYFDVTATVRALSGPATAQQNGSGLSSFIAFTYNMEVFISPFNSFAPDTTNWMYYASLPNADTNQVNIRSNRWLEAVTGINLQFPAAGPYITAGSGGLTYNLFEVRLRFSWPVLQNGNVGPGRQTYRTLVSAPLAPASPNEVPGWFFQPQYFANGAPSGL
jgi:type II secretory pathway pseudopilin PulG